VRRNEAQRQQLWEVFAATRATLAESGVMTCAAMFTALAASQPAAGPRPFDHVVVDEAQDLSVAQLRFLAAMAGDRPNGLFFAGDLGQRIFRTPFSWKSVGVDIRGRSRTLQVNYRTSHQIRMQADRLLGDQTADVDGNVDDRRGTVSVFNGPPPAVVAYASEAAEIGGIATWLQARVTDGMPPHEIGLFVRSAAELPRAKAAATAARLPFRILDDTVESKTGEASICVMHLAKGLEFRAVVVMACDDEILPLQSRIESVADDSDLEEVYNTERHLLYVACTRARDVLMVSCVNPGSEFLEDLGLWS
jgi:superfamily I DNA/RNA helicase